MPLKLFPLQVVAVDDVGSHTIQQNLVNVTLHVRGLVTAVMIIGLDVQTQV